MKQIPKAILQDSATYFQYAGQDNYGVPTYSDAIELKNIYIEPVTSALVQSLGEDERYELALYYDAVNSTPSVKFSSLDKIIYDGKEYGVRMVAKFFNPFTNKLHHSEVRLYGN